MQIFGLQYLKQKEHKVNTPNLFLLPHTTVERKSLKLGMHLNLKAASLRLSRYHLIFTEENLAVYYKGHICLEIAVH